MEISKGLQQEILAVQNKLKNAIRDHQICIGKLKDDPNNTDILSQIREIQLHIVTLGRCQKQVVQRLRKEVEAFKSENVNGAKVSVATLLGLNNNNHITTNNEANRARPDDLNATNKLSKEDYEENVRNGDIPSPTQDNAKGRPSSVETISGGEDDVIEVSMDENSCEKREEEAEKDDGKSESQEKVNFLNSLNLITKSRYAELQNKRSERKRRSTANPQFVYSSLEVPTKRKRYSYLQSVGNAPQTRQSTAKMNGPSPPPTKVSPPKSTSPPTRTVSKSLIPLQKTSGRPNILRNVTESKVFVNKTKLENGTTHVQLPSGRTIQNVDRKTVHIPGLPSSLTIERIENDSTVCINCRNPGILTVCESCSAKFHISCHSISPAPSKICPKCAVKGKDERLPCKKDEELVTTTYASRIAGKTGENSEVYKASRGLYKTDATQKKHQLPTTFTFGQLPSSTYLIPISSNAIPTSTVNQSQVTSSSATHYQQSEGSEPYSSIVLNQLPQPNVTYIQPESKASYAYQLPISGNQPEKHQSYLIVKKIAEPSERSGQHGEQAEIQNTSTVFNYQLPTSSGYNSYSQSGLSVTTTPMLLSKHIESAERPRRKSANRAVPALNRIATPQKFTDDYQLEQSVFNGRKSKVKQQRSKYGIGDLLSNRATEILLCSYDAEPDNVETKANKSEEAADPGAGAKCRSRSGSIFHSLFTGYNKPDSITGGNNESQGGGKSSGTNLANYVYQQRKDQQLVPNERTNELPSQPQRNALTKFFEHVKLEEAHLPAPLRTKLVRENADDSEENELEADEDDCQTIVVVENENAVSSHAGDDDCYPEKSKHDWVQNSHGKSRDITKEVEIIECSPEQFAKEDELDAYEKNNDDFTEDTSEDDITIIKETVSGSKKLTDEEAVLTSTPQHDLVEFRDEVSVPENKADTERQDLISGRRSTSEENDAPLEEPKEEQIDHSEMESTKDEEKQVEIDGVSLESMQVLEQFESAMIDKDRGSTATC